MKLLYRIDDNTEAMPVPTGIVILRTISQGYPQGCGCSVHSLFVPCSVEQRHEFFNNLPEEPKPKRQS